MGEKNMRKFTGVVLALTLCLGLAACGAEDSTGQAETPDTQAVQEAAGVSDKAGEDKTDQIHIICDRGIPEEMQ